MHHNWSLRRTHAARFTESLQFITSLFFFLFASFGLYNGSKEHQAKLS